MTSHGGYGLETFQAYLVLAKLVLAPFFFKVPVYVQMIGVSFFVIYLGSCRASEREIARKSGDTSAEPREVLSGFAVYRFPVVASCMLGGLFLAFKYLDKAWVSFCLSAFSITLGALTTITMFSALLTEAKLIPKPMSKKYSFLRGQVEIAPVDMVSAALTLPMAYWYWTKKHWLPNNLLGTSLALSAVEAMALEDFKSGAILLSGLFVYDIFWVFGSTKVFGDNVMVTVAKQFEGPIKLIFPRFPGAGVGDTSMLGLGDIVIPGFFIAMMLRFDESRKRVGRPHCNRPIFFYTVLSAYFIGLVCTFLALVLFDAAQPALLYLVPACLLSSTILAASLGEFQLLWSYTEEETSDSKESESKETEPMDSKETKAMDSAKTEAGTSTESKTEDEKKID